MLNKKFKNEAISPDNDKWKAAITRPNNLHRKSDEVRSEFERDYTRILHCESYRKLKHKTQVFFEPQNDLVCTRIEHVNHVESVSTTIAKQLGLNCELTSAIAIGHDLGHAPFGHEGEKILSDILKKQTGEIFWHEKNGLRTVDYLDLLEDSNRNMQNLLLTYAVRDGIISHCGEDDDTCIVPRNEVMDLNQFKKGVTQPFTWEACVVKLSDRIAYLGRDIEDAKRLRILTFQQLLELKRIAREYGSNTINTTVLIHDIIIDVCKNSSPNIGITTSERTSKLINKIKRYNYDNIYRNKRLEIYRAYVKLIVNSIFNILEEFYEKEDTIKNVIQAKQYPMLSKSFSTWLIRRSDIVRNNHSKNKKIYEHLESKYIYTHAIVDYISGMTDQFAVKIFNELCKF